MAFTKCKDCIYGDCFAGRVRSCDKYPSIGTTHIVTDDFFCFTEGKSREEWKREHLDTGSTIKAKRRFYQ